MQIDRQRQAEEAPAEAIAGKASVLRIAGEGSGPRVSVNIIYFAPGAHTAWHSHAQGQTLYVLSGRGLVQARGSERTEITAGDVVHADPGEEHWHGAVPGEGMSHLAVAPRDDDGAELPSALRRVTDAEYGA